MLAMHRPYNARNETRLAIDLWAIVRPRRSFRKLQARLLDLSPGGCRLSPQRALRPGARVLIDLPGLGPWPGQVAWTGAHATGVRFEGPLRPQLVSHYARSFPGLRPAV